MVRGEPLVEPGNGRGRCDPTARGFHRFQVDSFSFRTNHTFQDVTSRSADMRRNWFPSFSMGSFPVVLEFRIVPGWYKQVLFTRSSQLYPLAGFDLRQQFGGCNLVFQVCGGVRVAIPYPHIDFLLLCSAIGNAPTAVAKKIAQVCPDTPDRLSVTRFFQSTPWPRPDPSRHRIVTSSPRCGRVRFW